MKNKKHAMGLQLARVLLCSIAFSPLSLNAKGQRPYGCLTASELQDVLLPCKTEGDVRRLFGPPHAVWPWHEEGQYVLCYPFQAPYEFYNPEERNIGGVEIVFDAKHNIVTSLPSSFQMMDGSGQPVRTQRKAHLFVIFLRYIEGLKHWLQQRELTGSELRN